jgi:SPOR domain
MLKIFRQKNTLNQFPIAWRPERSTLQSDGEEGGSGYGSLPAGKGFDSRVIPGLLSGRLTSRMLLMTCLLCMGGCAAKPASPPPGNEAPALSGDTPALPDRLARLEGEVAVLRGSYDPAKPPIDRLEAIEGELHDLIAELRVETATEPAATIPSAAIATTPVDPPSIANDGKFAIHLASYQLKESVLDGWRDYRRQYRGVLDGLSPRVAAIDLKDGRGTFYRLKAGPFATRTAALAACRRIAAYPAGYCKVTDFSGTPGEAFWRRGAS